MSRIESREIVWALLGRDLGRIPGTGTGRGTGRKWHLAPQNQTASRIKPWPGVVTDGSSTLLFKSQSDLWLEALVP